MNRAQRRAAAKGKVVRPMVRMGLLTLDEAEILEEALDLYVRETEAMIEGEPDEREKWVLERAEQMRRLLYAGVHGGASHDTHNERVLPESPED